MWWHSHIGQQRSDGLFGALIVRQNEINDPHYHLYDYDLSEHVIFVMDWFNENGLVHAGPHVTEIGGKHSYSLLINGRGTARIFKNDSQSFESYFTPRSIFHVEQGKRYRFRLINSGLTSCPIEFSIENHNLIVIASDGHPIEPIVADSIVSYSGFKLLLNQQF